MAEARDKRIEQFAKALRALREQSDLEGEKEFLDRHSHLRDTVDPENEPSDEWIPTLETPPDDISREEPPERIGPYKILDVLGEGGMGVVYLADQQKPVRRRVALKLIKPGMDSRAVIARFESERQALAVMSHPNIARVLDAGTSELGRPYFVMEYVQGVPLTQYCDQATLTIRERLGLFMLVCGAVEHAHQKGIIHRDLKPSNILVAIYEYKPVPKIIDFGLAKATGARLTDKTLFTARGVFVGTPAYMSPEQADLTGLDIDTRADIYALGAILYELLVGELPFDFAEAVRKAAYEEIRRKICEEDPPKPSTRITTVGGKTTDLARKRNVDPVSLARRIRGDLDWITIKALEKDRTRRYSTATGLVADIARHLNHEPVIARPPSAAYKLKKFVRKNLGALVALAAVFLAVLGGAALATAFYFRAEERRIDAENAAKRETLAKNAAIRAKENEAEQRKLAQEKEKEAIAAKQREEEQRREAERQRDEVLRLSDIRRVQDLVSAADELWPAVPKKIPFMDLWLSRAIELKSRLTLHKASLLKLDTEEEPIPRASDMNSQVERAWRREALTQLVESLARFADDDPRVGTIANVEERVKFASTVVQRSVDDHREEWDIAITAIADEEASPFYRGLRLTPQVGLVPLGADPDSGLWEFAHIQTGQIPERDKDGKLQLSLKAAIVLVLIPGGTFRMGTQLPSDDHPLGSANVDPHSAPRERPVHEVELAAFFISKFEMTQGQWSDFTGSNPSMYRNSPRQPVEQVSWEECDRILNQLGLVLPTEAQWEYAARAGSTTIWWTGNEKESLAGAVNIADRTCQDGGGPPGLRYELWLEDGSVVQASVGGRRANPFGLHDVHGNVWEWCRDHLNFYSNPPRDDDGLREGEDDHTYVFRGGAYDQGALSARCGNRYNASKGIRFAYLGVRPSRVIDP